MLLTLAGLSRGSLGEAIGRWNGIDADLVIRPGSTSVTMASGGAIHLGTADLIQASKIAGQPFTQRVTPAYLARMSIGGRNHNVFGIRPDQYEHFGVNMPLLAGRLPDPTGQAASWLVRRYESVKDDEILEITADELVEANVLEMAIDTKLAAMLNKGVGDTFVAAGQEWSIVGIYQAGAVTRAIAPMETLQHVFNHDLERVTLLFVKLSEGVEPGAAIAAIRQNTHAMVEGMGEYQAMLMQNMGMMLIYVDMVNSIALVIAFLFIMTTLYTMVLQRTREIAILKSMGATSGYLMRQVLAESLLLTGAGTVIGIGMSLLAGRGIQALRPDLTVTITTDWIAIAIFAATAGGLLAGLYPAWRAIRLDVVTTLTYE